MGSIIDGTYRGSVRGPILITGYKVRLFPAILVAKLLARVLKDGVQFWYNDTSTVKGGGGGGGGGGGLEKTFLWKIFEVYVTSYQYLFQARSKFLKHTWLCEFVPLCFFTSLRHFHSARYTVKLIKMSNV
jgi:hypothetical protein